MHTSKTVGCLAVFIALPLMAWANPPWERPSAPPHALKPDVAVRAPDGRGDLHEAAAARSAVRPSQEAAAQRAPAPSTAARSPALPYKADVTVKVQGEAGAENAGAPSAKAASGTAGDKGAQKPHVPQTREEIQSFKKHTGINLPFGAHGSDDVQDKTE